MSCSVRSGLTILLCFVLLLLSSNASARRLGSQKHHQSQNHKTGSLLHVVINSGGRRKVLDGVKTGEVVVMDYPQPHRKPPIHNEKP